MNPVHAQLRPVLEEWHEAVTTLQTAVTQDCPSDLALVAQLGDALDCQLGWLDEARERLAGRGEDGEPGGGAGDPGRILEAVHRLVETARLHHAEHVAHSERLRLLLELRGRSSAWRQWCGVVAEYIDGLHRHGHAASLALLACWSAQTVQTAAAGVTVHNSAVGQQFFNTGSPDETALPKTGAYPFTKPQF